MDYGCCEGYGGEEDFRASVVSGRNTPPILGASEYDLDAACAVCSGAFRIALSSCAVCDPECRHVSLCLATLP